MTRWIEQFSPEHDFPMHAAAPRVRYVIASTPRSGSHFLGRMLRGTGLLGDPLEYFDSGNRQEWSRLAAAAGEDTLTYIQRRRTTPNGCFGMKLHFTQVGAALNALGPAKLFDDHQFLLIRRRDVLRQAVSFSVAEHTGSWISAVPPRADATYDFDGITRCLQEVCMQEAQWRAMLAVRCKNYLEILYEDLMEDPTATVRRIAEYVGIDSGEHITGITPATSRQTGDTNERVLTRYIDDITANAGDWQTARQRIASMRRTPFSAKRVTARMLANVTRVR
jgi:LPS sulfotransferase NodH